MEIKTIIVDDEPLARGRIQNLLKEFPFIKVISECATGEEALQILKSRKVELMFLDIQMPEMNGVELIQHLPSKSKPLIVFVTAYDQYAIEAFDHFAVDYLLKPYSNERFRKTLKRVVDRYFSKDKVREQSLSQLFEYLHERQFFPLEDKLKVELAGKIYFIDIPTIEYVRSEGNYLVLKAEGKQHVIRQTFNELHPRLKASLFIRIHRSTIINLEYLEEIRRTIYSELEVKMKDGKVFRVSRTYKSLFSQRLQI